METSVFPKQRYAGVIKKLGPSSALQGTELRKNLRNFKKVYRNNKLGKSDFKKFRKKKHSKKQTKLRNYDIMKTSRTHQKTCYQSFIRSRNLLKLQLIDEEAYRRVCQKNKSDTSQSVATAISSNSVYSRIQEKPFALESSSDQFTQINLRPDVSSFRKMSCSSTANLYPSSSQSTGKQIESRDFSNLINPRKRFLNEQNQTACMLFKTPQDKSKNKKNITFSVDKAASPVVNRCFSFELKTPKADAFQIWEDCNFNLFAESKEEIVQKRRFSLEDFCKNQEEIEGDMGLEILFNEKQENQQNEILCSIICVDKNCKNKLCCNNWNKPKQPEPLKNEEIFEILDYDLGKGKSLSIVKGFIAAKKVIFQNYSEFNLIKKIKKKKKKQKKTILGPTVEKRRGHWTLMEF